MNVAEKLAREIARVTELRCQYESLRGIRNANPEPAIAMMTAALEGACLAAGHDCALDQMEAIRELEGFTG